MAKKKMWIKDVGIALGGAFLVSAGHGLAHLTRISLSEFGMAGVGRAGITVFVLSAGIIYAVRRFRK